jgi:hypothetical protein
VVIDESTMFTRLWLLLVVLVAACGGGESLAGFGEPCRTNDQCADGVCFGAYANADGTCTSACTSNDECADGTTCGTLVDGSRICLTACTDSGFTRQGFGCVDGAQVACERAGDAAPCSQCGCASGEYCPSSDTGVKTCQPLAAEGESCVSNQECASGNCSVHDSAATQPGTCLKAHGAACVPGEASCLSCDGTAQGNVCAKGCDTGEGCGGGDVCIGRPEEGYFCRPSCAGSARCPAYWECRVLSDYCEPPRRCDPSQSLPCGLNGDTCHPELHICYGPF